MSSYHTVIDTAADALKGALTRIERNPVLVGVAVLWGADAVTGHPLTWRLAAEVVVGVLVRSKVVPANEVELIENKADAAIHAVAEAAKAGLPPDAVVVPAGITLVPTTPADPPPSA